MAMSPTSRARAALVALALASGAASAAGNHDVAVSATILANSNCRFANAGPSTLAFGVIDPTSVTAASVSVGIGYRCNGGPPLATYAIVSDDGLYETGPGNHRMRHATVLTEFLPYTLNVPASASVPRNTNLTFTLVGTVPVAAFANARAGNYTDSVTLTISP